MDDSRDGKGPTVLIADDDAGLRALARVTLTAQGWTVREAATPDECLALARRHRPDVLLLDVNFEGQRRDGYSVCRELKAAADTRSMPIVLFTARDEPEGRAFASAVGASAFIVKPFSPLDLADLLQVLRHGSERDPGIGLYLIEVGVIRPAQLERALAEQHLRQGKRMPLGEILVELGFASADDVRRAVERQRRLRLLAAPGPRSAVVRRVLIADDNASVRDGLREAFASESDFLFVGAAVDGVEALRMIRETKPDVVVLDSDMPRLSGIEVLRTMHASLPETRVVMFTLNDAIRETALAAGAAAIVTKDTPLESLLAELRRAAPPPKPIARRAAVILAGPHVPGGPWSALARRRQAIAAIGVLLVSYTGAFLLAEPALGASASLLAMLPVAIAGALFGPEVGIGTALLSTIVTAALWSVTNHAIGEPVLRIGGNGIGVVALVAIGAGFGAMRLVRGRLVPRGRLVDALAEAAVALGPGLGPRTLGLLAEAALEIVPGDTALIYVAVPGGGLELVAAAGAPDEVIGQRDVAGAVAAAVNENRASIVDDLEARPIGVSLPRSRSCVVVPVAGRGEAPSGVIAVLAGRKNLYNAGHLEALTSYASFLGSLLNAPARAVPVQDPALLPAIDPDSI
ncbi:MAG: response regulator [Chloroflexi bacterium]|nr:MAG: response regulator [Chloroflexota bacterium]